MDPGPVSVVEGCVFWWSAEVVAPSGISLGRRDARRPTKDETSVFTPS